MPKNVEETAALLRKKPETLGEIMQRDLPLHGRPWVLALVLVLEGMWRDADPSSQEDLPLWVKVLLAGDKQHNGGPGIDRIDNAQWIDPLAQAVARWLGFSAGHDPMDLLINWLDDTSVRSASIGPLVLPFLEDSDARELCLENIGERSDVNVTIALSPRWFDAHGAGLLDIVAKYLQNANAAAASKWAGVLAAAMVSSARAEELLVAFAFSGEKRAHQIARDALRGKPSATLAALEHKTFKKKKEQSLAKALVDDCRILVGIADCPDADSIQHFLEKTLPVDLAMPSPANPITRMLPPAPLFAALRKIKHPVTLTLDHATSFAAGYARLCKEEPFLIEFELLAKDWQGRSEANRAEADAWFSAQRGEFDPLDAEPYEKLLIAAKGDPHWKAVLSSAIVQVAEQKRHVEEMARENAAKAEARKAAKRAVFAARDAALVNEFVAKNRKLIGKRLLSRDEFGPVPLDLGKLLRCGWRKQESEETHKFIPYLVRYIESEEARIRPHEDIPWDELPERGFTIDYIHLPEPFGNRSPRMDRMLGEILSARMQPPTPKTTNTKK